MSEFSYTKPVILFRFPLESTKENFESIYESLERRLGQDYHVLAIVENNSEEMRIEVFNARESVSLEIENLKTEIKDSLKTLQNLK